MIRQSAFFLATTFFFVSSLPAQNRSVVTTDPLLYGVSYVDVVPASRTMAIAALKQYGEASRKDAGYLSLDLFEQIGRPGHFVILEKWADQKSFDAHGMADHTKQLVTKLDPVRLGFDQRPYRTFAVAAAPRANDRAVIVVSHVDTAGTQVDGLALLRQLAERSRKEEGNVRFDVLQGATRPNHFALVEIWQSQKAMDAHSQAADTREFRNTIQPVLGSPLDERIFKLLD